MYCALYSNPGLWYLSLLRKTGFVEQELSVGFSVFSSPFVCRRDRQVNLETSNVPLTVLHVVRWGGIQRRSSWLWWHFLAVRKLQSHERRAYYGCKRMKQKLFCGVLWILLVRWLWEENLTCVVLQVRLCVPLDGTVAVELRSWFC